MNSLIHEQQNLSLEESMLSTQQTTVNSEQSGY